MDHISLRDNNAAESSSLKAIVGCDRSAESSVRKFWRITIVCIGYTVLTLANTSLSIP